MKVTILACAVIFCAAFTIAVMIFGLAVREVCDTWREVAAHSATTKSEPPELQPHLFIIPNPDR